MPSSKKPKIRLDKNRLTLDARLAKTPGIVRAVLPDDSLETFFVRTNDQDAVLGFTNAQGAFTPLASFSDRASADMHLAALRDALLKPSFFEGFVHTAKIIGVILIVFFLFVTIIGQMVDRVSVQPKIAKTQTSSVGMPVDADAKFAPAPPSQ
jgi:hypothetical protein